jgi:hypothetical protein
MGGEIKNLQFINSGITEISKIVFYNKFPIPIIIPKLDYILIFRDRNTTDYLNNLTPYINKIILKLNKKL